MRVAQVVKHGVIRGGAETYVATLAEGLVRAGHDVALFCGPDADASRPEVAAGAIVAALGTPETTEDSAGLEQALRAYGPDVIHVHVPEAPWVLQACERVAPTVLAVQDHRLNCPTGTKYWAAWGKACTVRPGAWCLVFNAVAHCGSLKANATLEPYRSWRAAVRAVRGSNVNVQVFSAAMAALVDPVLGRATSVTHYPAPALSPEPPPPEPSSAFDAPVARTPGPLTDRRPVVLAMGRLNREKGFRLLLDAVGGVRPAMHLVIVGDGHDRPALERRAKTASGGHRITFTGWLGRVERDAWLRKSRIVVVPSMWPEPFGIVGLEAMQASKPVVAFRSGGIPEWLRDGETGVLIEPGDRENLARQLSHLLADVDRRRELGEAGHNRAQTEFTLDDHIADVEALYARARA